MEDKRSNNLTPSTDLCFRGPTISSLTKKISESKSRSIISLRTRKGSSLRTTKSYKNFHSRKSIHDLVQSIGNKQSSGKRFHSTVYIYIYMIKRGKNFITTYIQNFKNWQRTFKLLVTYIRVYKLTTNLSFIVFKILSKFFIKGKLKSTILSNT